jgi:hypothetical protein
MIREQKYLLRHRSHCRYRHRPQIARPVLTQGLPRLATSNFIRYNWELGKSQPKDQLPVAVLFSRAQTRPLIAGFMDQQNGGEE